MVGTTRSRICVFMNRFKESGFVYYEPNRKALQVHRTLLAFCEQWLSVLRDRCCDYGGRGLWDLWSYSGEAILRRLCTANRTAVCDALPCRRSLDSQSAPLSRPSHRYPDVLRGALCSLQRMPRKLRIPAGAHHDTVLKQFESHWCGGPPKQ
jgi:hypothetical protein